MAADRDVFVSKLKTELDDTIRMSTTGHVDLIVLQNSVQRLNKLETDVSLGTESFLCTDLGKEVGSMIAQLKNIITRLINSELKEKDKSGYQPSKTNGTRGTPKYDIKPESIRFLLSCNFSPRQIADMLKVSEKTIKRRIGEFNIPTVHFTDIPDGDLDTKVKEVTLNNKRLGEKSVTARLLGLGIKVQRRRIRESMKRVDPGAAALRSLTAARISRRAYRVKGPNSLWHFDGYHKLIRWRFVVHAGIDGFSRLIVFMKVSTNNKAETVLDLFKEATASYGLPSRVRCDMGVENTLVCSYMEEKRGEGRGSAIRGRSVHNQRIERLWVDLWNGCINVYYDLFYFMERNGLLDRENEVHIFLLHYVFLPRIQRSIEQFIEQWNSHQLRTEHQYSPLQMFVKRSLELYGTTNTAVQDIFAHSEEPTNVDCNTFGVDQDGDATEAASDQAEESIINVPSNTFILTDEKMSLLKENINPLFDSDEDNKLGIWNFLEAKKYVE